MNKIDMRSGPSFWIATLLMYVFLGAGAYSYFQPMIVVKASWLGEKSLAASDVVEAIPRGIIRKEKKEEPVLDVKIDYQDILEKIVPKNQESGTTKKISLTFILSALVPFAVALSYLSIVLCCLFGLAGRGGLFSKICGAGFLFSAYSVIGIYYMSLAAQESFRDAANKAGSGILGALAKNFVQEFSIQPGVGVFVLTAGLGLAFMLNFYRRHDS